MPSGRVVRVGQGSPDGVEALRRGVERIRGELDVTPDFAPEVDAAAVAAAADPRLPGLDRTDLPLVTVDPAGAQDLDQALHLARVAPEDHGDGAAYAVHYAIADVAAFVSPGDPVDVESHQRGETLYGADAKIPLHPPALSEDAASLLPDRVRPALLWTIRLDADGARVGARVERARVRSRARLTYEEVQAAVDDGTADEPLRLLREVGELRIARERARGGVDLPLPDQEVVVHDDGRWSLELRRQLPSERWNAQVSLLTGFAAAAIMLDGRVGLLRTLPPPDPRDVERLRRTAAGLGLDWPAEQDYPDFVRGLDPSVPAEAAMTVASTRLLRGSGYAAFDGERPDQPRHAALAGEYAHVTAPLRRLADRYASEACVALCAGEPVPSWVTGALPDLPGTMTRSAQRARAYENAVVSLVEAGVLADRVGEELDGVVVEVEADDDTEGTVLVREVAVEAPVRGGGPLELGSRLRVRLAEASVEDRRVVFTPA